MSDAAPTQWGCAGDELKGQSRRFPLLVLRPMLLPLHSAPDLKGEG